MDCKWGFTWNRGFKPPVLAEKILFSEFILDLPIFAQYYNNFFKFFSGKGRLIFSCFTNGLLVCSFFFCYFLFFFLFGSMGPLYFPLYNALYARNTINKNAIGANMLKMQKMTSWDGISAWSEPWLGKRNPLSTS